MIWKPKNPQVAVIDMCQIRIQITIEGDQETCEPNVVIFWG